MSIWENIYANAWRGVASSYENLAYGIATHGPMVGSQPWDEFQGAWERLGKWSSIIAGTQVRYKALHEKTLMPAGGETDIGYVIDANPWLAKHAEVMNPLIEQRAKWIREAEETYLDKKSKAIAQLIGTPGHAESFPPFWRIERQRRDAIGEISNVSEQVQLAVPEIDAAFPFAKYLTREDKRVRPTHAAMFGFVAARSWNGWTTIRPRCGWNCRCYLNFVARFQARRLGWLDAHDKPTFITKWPNSLSEQNYRSGVFPDKGWQGPKFWSATGTPLDKAA